MINDANNNQFIFNDKAPIYRGLLQLRKLQSILSSQWIALVRRLRNPSKQIIKTYIQFSLNGKKHQVKDFNIEIDKTHHA